MVVVYFLFHSTINAMKSGFKHALDPCSVQFPLFYTQNRIQTGSGLRKKAGSGYGSGFK
jgi:hypothetical protein